MGIKLKTLLKNKNRILELNSPIIGASGTWGYCDELFDFVNKEYFGSLVTKGITLEKRLGNEGDRIFEVQGGMINRIGLENIGIEAFIKEKLPILKKKNIDFILNVAGSNLEDYEKISKIANDNNIKAIEVNVSCPNVKSGCIEFGLNPDSLYSLTKKVRNNYSGFLIVKLSPNTSDIKPLAQSVQEAGADAISAINTLRGLEIKLDFDGEKYTKTAVQGGLSGKCIKPVAMYMVNEIKKAVSIPVIAMGGISTLEDILEFLSIGADAFQIGTANFANPSICSDLAVKLEKYIEKTGLKNFEELKETIRKS